MEANETAAQALNGAKMVMMDEEVMEPLTKGSFVRSKLPVSEAVSACCLRASKQVRRHRTAIKQGAVVLGACLFLAYVVAATVLNATRARPLIGLSVAIIVGTIWHFKGDLISSHANTLLQKITACCGKRGTKWTERLFYSGIIVAFVLYMALVVRPKPRQFIPISGFSVLILFLFVFSKYPRKVQPRTLIGGLLLQLLLAVLVLRTTWGRLAATWIANQMRVFLSYSEVGASFVFGEKYTDHEFAFKVLPVVIFFGSCVTTLYHLGIMQAIIRKLAWIMRIAMATSATESTCAAGNIFIGMTEAPMMVAPFLSGMTMSEIHAMLTAGFATMAGGVLAVYIMLGVPAEHLICASIMNAPMALAAAKLFYPETEESETRAGDIATGTSPYHNVLDAMSSGASATIKLVAGIAANIIAFLAMLKLGNATVSWLGAMVDRPDLTLEVLASYLYIPLVVMMGVDWSDCGEVARLLGVRTFLNEFVAYKDLSTLIHNRHGCIQPYISVRSEVISTYALCGFANLSSMGIQMGALGALVPERRTDVSKVAVRALIAGTLVSFMTACVAGLLTTLEEEPLCQINEGNLTSFIAGNATLGQHLPSYNITL